MLPLLLSLLTADPAPTLGARIAPLVKEHKGRAAVAVKHLVTGEEYYLNADAVMPTASLIKLPILVEAYLQADEGKINLGDKVTLHDADKVPGSGLLTYHFSDGASFPLRDAVRLMIAFSDNTATNLVLDKVGIGNVNQRMGAWGLPETRLNAKVFLSATTSVDPERSKKYGLGSTTARETAKLLEEIMLGTRLRPPAKQALLGHLRRNDDKDKFARLLPPGTALWHKDGSVSDSRTDAGVIDAPSGPVVVVVLTTENADRRWAPDNAGNLLCARVARAAYDHFTPRPAP
jgi:beta-lactamase class A